jgi:WD40 repeat protein
MNNIFNLFSGTIHLLTNFIHLIKRYFIKLQRRNICALSEQVPTNIIENKQLDMNINVDMNMDKLMYNDNPMNERRKIIVKYLYNFIPNDLAKLISDYDYYLEGKIYTFSTRYYFDRFIAVLPDKRIVGDAGIPTLKIWNLETDECEATLEGHSKRVSCISVFPDGRIITGSYDNTLVLWNTPLGNKPQKDNIIFRGHTDGISCVTTLSNGRIISGSYDNTVKIWNAQTGNCVLTFTEHDQHINRLFALSDGRIISSSNCDTIKNWDSMTGICNFTIQKDFHCNYTFSILTDERIISIIDNNIFNIYNAKTGLCDITFEYKLDNYIENLHILRVLPDGQFVVRTNCHTIKIIKLEDLSLKEISHIETSSWMGLNCLLSDGRLIIMSQDYQLNMLY